MDIPIKIINGVSAIDFTTFMRALDKKYDIEYRNMSKRDKVLKKACVERGIDYMKWYNKQFTKMDAIELEVKEIGDNIPFQDVWHWMMDNDFEGLQKSSCMWLWLNQTRLNDKSIPDYVITVLKAIRAEVENTDVWDDEQQSVYFYFDW